MNAKNAEGAMTTMWFFGRGIGVVLHAFERSCCAIPHSCTRVNLGILMDGFIRTVTPPQLDDDRDTQPSRQGFIAGGRMLQQLTSSTPRGIYWGFLQATCA